MMQPPDFRTRARGLREAARKQLLKLREERLAHKVPRLRGQTFLTEVEQPPAPLSEAGTDLPAETIPAQPAEVELGAADMGVTETTCAELGPTEHDAAEIDATEAPSAEGAAPPDLVPSLPEEAPGKPRVSRRKAAPRTAPAKVSTKSPARKSVLPETADDTGPEDTSIQRAALAEMFGEEPGSAVSRRIVRLAPGSESPASAPPASAPPASAAPASAPPASPAVEPAPAEAEEPGIAQAPLSDALAMAEAKVPSAERAAPEDKGCAEEEAQAEALLPPEPLLSPEALPSPEAEASVRPPMAVEAGAASETQEPKAEGMAAEALLSVAGAQTPPAALVAGDLDRLPGAGPGLIWMLRQCGIFTLADLAACDAAALGARLGLVGQILDVSLWRDFALREAEALSKAS